MTYLLGIDIGTSACKAALFDASGKAVAQASESYPVYRPRPGWAEQDPDEWYSAACAAVKRLIAQSNVGAGDIAAVGIDGQSWAAIPIDGGGNVIGRNPIWFDTRASDICAEWRESVGEDKIFGVCGNPVSPSYTLPKIMWLKKHEPQMYRRAVKFLQSNGYIVYRLTGETSLDLSQCYGYQNFDMRKGEFDADMSMEMGVDSSLAPPIRACHDIVGRVTKEAAAVTGLREGTPVVAGGLDAACATLGAGVVDAGQTQEQGGQAGGMSICVSEYKSHPKLILGRHVVPERWLLQGGTTGGGGALKWLKERLFPDMTFEEMSAAAETVPPGCEGLTFLPYMAGERSPIWNPDAKGVFFGLDYQKTRAHVIRAVMEGVALSLKHNLAVAEDAGAVVATLNAMGGAANSAVWTRIKADATGKRVVVPSSDTATTLGAAMLAGVGVGVWKDCGEAAEIVKITAEYEPNAGNCGVYDKRYYVYRELYESTKNLMERDL